MSQSKTSLFPGILLIIFGLLILIHKLDLFYFNWPRTYPLVFMVLGIMLFILAIAYKNMSGAFWGTILLLTGIVFFLRNYHYLEYYYSMSDLWPVFVIIIGIAFVVLFIFKPQDWGVLIPGSIFLFIGTSLFLRNFNYWRAQEIVERYWPLILIVIGIGVILSGARKRTEV